MKNLINQQIVSQQVSGVQVRVTDIAYEYAQKNNINLEKIMRRGVQDRINIYDLHYYMKQPKQKDFSPVSDFFKIRTSHKNIQSNSISIDNNLQQNDKALVESSDAIQVNFDYVPSSNPKYEMPQIQLTRKVYLDKAESILQQINRDSDIKFQLEDFILKAASQVCYDIPQFRQTEQLLLVYRNLEDQQKNKNIWLDQPRNLSYYQKQNLDVIITPFFLIEDSGDLPLTRIQPILYYQNVFLKEWCFRYKSRII